MKPGSATFGAMYAAAIAAAIACPPAALADTSNFDGTYFAQSADGQTTLWTVSSDCETEGCRAHFTTAGGWSGDLTMTGGRWVGTTFITRAYHCFLQWHDGDVTFSVDPVSLTGSYWAAPNPHCNPPPMSFTLSRSGGSAPVPPPSSPPPGSPPPGWKPPANLPGFEGPFPPGVNPSTGMPQDPNIGITGG